MRALLPAANDRWGASAARLGSRAASVSSWRPIRTSKGPSGSRRATSSGSPEIVAKILKLERSLTISNDLIPGGNPQALIRQLNDLKPAPENILLVGHEPYLSRLIALLSSGGMSAAIDMKKGSLCKLETEELEYGHCATLKWLLTPRQMELMA